MKQLVTATFLLLCMLPQAAQAQPNAEWTPQRWQQVADQAVRNLNSEYPAIQTQGLKHIIYLAEVHPDKVTLDQAVDRVVRLYESDAQATIKNLALAALESIGSTEARQFVRARVTVEDRMHTLELIVSVVDEQRTALGGASL
jgi:hypothetical protein